MTEAMYRIESLPNPPGHMGMRVALAAVPHLLPLVGLALFDWDVFEAAMTYWASLGAYLVYAILRMWRASKRLAQFFILHGGVFWLASIEFVFMVKDGPAPWLRLLLYALLAAGGIALQEWRLGRLEVSEGREPQGLTLIGRFYVRFLVLAFSLFMVDGVAPRTQGWLLLGMAAAIESALAMLAARWPWRLVRNVPAASPPVAP